jgi:abequosyltransferase
MPTLTICIPTYNRATLLIQALEAVTDQLTEANVGLVELLISDNASPDQTQDIVASFAAAHPQIPITYVRQSQNLGADGNVNYLIGHAAGDFALLLSDDDILLPGAIDKILDILTHQPNVDAISLNARTFAVSPDELTVPIRQKHSDHLINDRDELLTTLGTWLTFVSILIFRTSAIARQGYAQRVGTNFPQAYVFLDVLAHNRGCWLTAQPYIAIRSNNTGGYNFFQAFVSDFAALLDHAVQIGYSKEAARCVLKKHQAFILGFVIAFKVRGTYGNLRPDFLDGLKRIWHVYRTDPIFLLKVTPLLLLPRSTVPMLRSLRRNFQRKS